MTPSPLSAFEASNRHLLAPVREHLAFLATDRLLQARFLNMLSLLEHIGSRKIMTCRAMANADQPILRHLAEETRHALFFKRAAEKMAGRPLDYADGNVAARAAAEFYMGRLDAEIGRALGPAAPALPYLYMSLIVELRAVWTYRIYQQVLNDGKHGFALQGILAEEEQHLGAMLARVREVDGEADTRVAQFSGFEHMRFLSLWSAITAESAKPRLAAE
jgi:hypothetical protein